MRPLKFAFIGLGQGAAGTVPALAQMPEIDLIAGCDINPPMRKGFTDRYPGTKGYATIEELCRDKEVEAVWVATPNRFHCEHAIAAMRARQARDRREADGDLARGSRIAWSRRSRRIGVVLLAGHTRSLSIWNRAMRRIIVSGALGPVRAIHIWAYTDWMIRPRTADELDPNQGGGIVFRQGPHQIDTLRLLGGGMLRSVRGMTGRWLEARPVPGYFTAYMEFEDGTPATIMHNGYGYFIMADRSIRGSSRSATTTIGSAPTCGTRSSHGGRNEDEEKSEFRVGGKHDPAATAATYAGGPVSVEAVRPRSGRGRVRTRDHARRRNGDSSSAMTRAAARSTCATCSVPKTIPRAGLSLAIVEELHARSSAASRPFTPREWGRATLEAVLAVIESAHEHKEIVLKYQVPMSNDYDAELPIGELVGAK